jgi:putative NADPH-quinone reductase
MPETLVVLVHPNLKESRINATWKAALAAHPGRITVHDLHAAAPGGKIDVAAEQALVRAHTRVIFQFPLYWFSSPPLLKQWFDEVLGLGFAYGPGGDAFEGKDFGVAVSTGSAASAFRAGGQDGFTLDEILRPFQATAGFLRARYLPYHAFHGAGEPFTDEELAANAAAYVAWALGETPVG